MRINPPEDSGRASPTGEGRCRRGSNGHCTRRTAAAGPGIQEQACGNNVGKDHLPAGTGDNLQRPIVEAKAEGAGRDLVRRMSPDERRRGGNAPRGGARRRAAGGDSRDGQRDSGHLAVLKGGAVRSPSRGAASPPAQDEFVGKLPVAERRPPCFGTGPPGSGTPIRPFPPGKLLCRADEKQNKRCRARRWSTAARGVPVSSPCRMGRPASHSRTIPSSRRRS